MGNFQKSEDTGAASRINLGQVEALVPVQLMHAIDELFASDGDVTPKVWSEARLAPTASLNEHILATCGTSTTKLTFADGFGTEYDMRQLFRPLPPTIAPPNSVETSRCPVLKLRTPKRKKGPLNEILLFRCP